MPGPMITMPEVPELGLPEGEKERGQRVDFRPTKFDLVIETKGYLLAWTRACICPCAPVSEDADQPDPNCSRCGGEGWFYFGGSDSTGQDLTDYQFDPVQQYILDTSGAMVIRGLLTGLAAEYDPLDRLSNWQAGTMQATVRHQNRLGLYDRLVVLDSEIVFSELVLADGSGSIPTRYPVTGVNQILGYTSTGFTEFQADRDYQIDDQGRVEWLAAAEPEEGTRLGCHYLCHPTFLVVEHPHVIRATQKTFKIPEKDRRTPLGDPRQLPIQAMVKYEFARR